MNLGGEGGKKGERDKEGPNEGWESREGERYGEQE